jgi:hypothetical protein
MGKARRERRRLERERAMLGHAAATRETSAPIEEDQQLSVEEGVADAQEDGAEQAGKEAYSGGTLVQVVQRDQPKYSERMQTEYERYGQTYEEANWAKLSPIFREQHNQLRVIRGLPPIPPPAIDLYKPPMVKRADPKELEALDREAKAAQAQFLGQRRMMAPGREGFTIDGEDVPF